MQQGFALMGYGMGVVFVFLTLLVFSTTLMSHLINRYFPVPEPVIPARPSRTAPVSPAAQDQQLVAVLSAAIRKFKSRRDNNKP